MLRLSAQPQLIQSLPDLAYDHLRREILAGTLTGGSPLRQHEIASQLGVSPLPVREALRRLEVEGWVVLRPRRGYVVASLSRGEIEEVFEIQGMLEGRAAFYATQRRTPKDIEALEERLAQLDRLLGAERLDLEAFGRANAAFHEQLFEASGRSYYCRILRTLRNTAERYARVGASMLHDLHDSQAEHNAILEAFRSGDAPDVARLCLAHRENTRERLLSSLHI